MIDCMHHEKEKGNSFILMALLIQQSEISRNTPKNKNNKNPKQNKNENTPSKKKRQNTKTKTNQFQKSVTEMST